MSWQRGGGPGEASRSCHVDAEIEDGELDRVESTLRRRKGGGVALKGRQRETLARQHPICFPRSQKRKSKSIWIKDIAIKSLDSIPDNPSEYEYVNPKIPIIVVEGLQNKDNKKYRLLDGRHRILKTLKRDRAAINAHVFSFDEIEPYIEIYRSCINPKCDANPIDLQVICQYCGTRQFSSKKIKPL